MKLWKKLTAAVLMSAAMLGAGLIAKPLFPALTGAEIAAQAEGETVTVGDLTFELTDTYAIVKSCKRSAETVTIPETVNGLPVKIIGEAAFHNYRALTKISIPNGVTSIRDDAFYYCDGLSEINLPDSIKYIGKLAFSNCKSLTSITIPDSVTSIGTGAFEYCINLTSITIPDSMTSIGSQMVFGCYGLTSITIPNSVTSIGWGAFSNCTGLTSITIPDSVTSIGESAFYHCIGLTDITIPNSVASIGNGAFSYCKSLKSIKIPDGVTSIGGSMFSGCTGLTSITIPNHVTSIGDGSFRNCTSLESITIPDSVTSIGRYAFESCSRLTSIMISDRVTEIGACAFSLCRSLQLTVSPDSSYFCTEDGLLYTKDRTRLLWCSVRKAGTVDVPDGVQIIDEYAFYKCNGLTEVMLPESVTSIGHSAFSDCTRLESITIPAGVTSIDDFVFDGCTALTGITIPNHVTSIGYGSFKSCTSLESITIPDSVKRIGELAFYGCKNLTITGIKGSKAEYYAAENQIPFSVISVTLSRTSFSYTGSPVKVGKYLSVYSGGKKLEYETDFTLRYADNVNCGVNTARVTAVGIGIYAGYSRTAVYSIGPALSTKKGRLHIEWSAVEGADGYQVQYCKDPSFTGDTVHTASVTKLYCDLATYPKTGETWYIRVRSYTTTSTGGKKYGAWSGASGITLGTIDNVSLKYTAFHYKDGAPVKVGKYLTVYSGDNTKLEYGKDFTLVYKNNVKRGTASVTIKGIGEYAGSSVTKTYKIV